MDVIRRPDIARAAITQGECRSQAVESFGTPFKPRNIRYRAKRTFRSSREGNDSGLKTI
jgi:hypothetical protein